MSKVRNIFKEVTLPANGQAVSLDLGGTFFRCSASTAKFQLALDDGAWMQFEKGLRVDEKFDKLRFKILEGAAAEVAIEFYYGTGSITDNRLNIISGDEDQARLFVRPVETIGNPWSGSVANNGTVDFNGVLNPDGAPILGAGGRKELIVCCDGPGNERFNLMDPATGTVWAIVRDLQPMEHFEVMDVVRIKNVSGHAANLYVNEVNFLNA